MTIAIGPILFEQVHAASLNPADYKVRNGSQKALLKFVFPQAHGFDFSGSQFFFFFPCALFPLFLSLSFTQTLKALLLARVQKWRKKMMMMMGMALTQSKSEMRYSAW